MLEIIEYGKDEYEFPALVVLGCFDAIHEGHRELLKKAKLQAKINGLDLGVMMFREGKTGKLVYSFEERCAILEQYNVKFVLAVDFNDEFKAVAPLDFLHEVEDKINVKAYMSGKDFRFGAQAKGKSSTLKNYAEDEENGVWYMPVKDVVSDGEKISTTLIKACLDAGNVAKANALLGSEFSVSGEVVKGEGRGASVVGFPTVNIVYPEWKHPLKHGVYSVKCLVGDTDYQGIANFGTCPTFGDERVALEVYLEGFSGDLYGQVLTIRFIDYIRDIEEFASAEELSSQLQNDLSGVTDELAVTEETTVAEEEPVVTEEPEVAVEKSVTTEEETTAVEESAAEVTSEVVEELAVAEEVTEEAAEEPAEAAEEMIEESNETIVEDIDEPAETEVAEEVAEQSEETTEEETKEAEEPTDDGLDEFIEILNEEVVVEEAQSEETEQADEVIYGDHVEKTSDDHVAETVEDAVEVTDDEAVEELTAENGETADMQYTEGEESLDAEGQTEVEQSDGTEGEENIEALSDDNSDGDEN